MPISINPHKKIAEEEEIDKKTEENRINLDKVLIKKKKSFDEV